MSQERAEAPNITVIKALSYENIKLEKEIFGGTMMSGDKINLEKGVH